MWSVSGSEGVVGTTASSQSGSSGALQQRPPAKRLLHSYKDGRARFNAYLDDYAAFIDGLVSIYESSFDPNWLNSAVELGDAMVSQYWDEEGGSFFYTPQEHEPLITRVRDLHDSATPSGNSLAVTALLRIGRLTGRTDLIEKAERTLRSFAGVMAQAPRAVGQMLIALDFTQQHPIEIVIAPATNDSATEETAQALRTIREVFLPSKVVAMAMNSGAAFVGKGLSDQVIRTSEAELGRLVPLVNDKIAVGGRVTVYVCENYACQSPIIGVDAIQKAMKKLARSRQE
jgi:uncharacterized protein YyaL (SSP411 family)